MKTIENRIKLNNIKKCYTTPRVKIFEIRKCILAGGSMDGNISNFDKPTGDDGPVKPRPESGGAKQQFLIFDDEVIE